jgi:hypothetical protein
MAHPPMTVGGREWKNSQQRLDGPPSGLSILAAAFAAGGLYQGVAISNGNSAGDVYLFNRFTGTYYVCRNRSCQMGKVSN